MTHDHVLGLHHVTAIAGDPQENLDFYNDVLGLRLVKKSVNQDDPKTYHLFYADADGRPGTDLTFFPWTQLAPAQKGVGLTTEVMLAVPSGSLSYWQKRLTEQGAAVASPVERFGERSLPFRDPHGLELALVEIDEPRPFSPWQLSPVPAEKQILGLHGVRLWERELERTTEFLTEVMGFEALGQDNGWHRYRVAADGKGASGHLLDIRPVPDGRRGHWGTGSVHHVAWSVRDLDHERALRQRVALAGRRPSDVIDRFWFQSVYFMEPGGVLFELATEGPGFAVDEAPEHLGERLILPPWLEPHRSQIEAALPPLRSPDRAPVGG
ncbi:MAG: ring-cleaving dioxygenase, partial [Trueperaceae bacterium]